MKNLLLPILMMTSLSAFAGEKGNGGLTIDVDGVPRLRDLVDKTTCDWRNGQRVVDENPYINDILKRLSTVDWYFSDELKQEILSLDFCLTKKLMRINTYDYGSVITSYEHRSSQVAIRFNYQVYVDTDITARMSDYDKAFLVIHEAMHSYIPRGVFMRNNKVRSQVKAIESVVNGTITSTYDFHTSMRNNEVDFPLSVLKLTALKENFSYVVGNYDVRRNIILGLSSVEAFFKKMNEISPYDLVSHAENLACATVTQLISQAIAEKDVEVLKKLLQDSKSVKELVLSLLIDSSLAEENVEFREMLAQRIYEDLTKTLFFELMDKKVSKNEDGRMVVSGMEILAAHGFPDTEFTALNALDGQSSANVNPRLRVFMQILKKLTKKNDQNLLARIVFENTAFYQAFSKTIKAEIAQTDATFVLEKNVALRKVDTLVDGFWSLLKAEFSSELPKGAWKAFVQKIDAKKLGYEIK